MTKKTDPLPSGGGSYTRDPESGQITQTEKPTAERGAEAPAKPARKPQKKEA